MTSRSGLVDTHLVFVDALRGAGLPVSLAEGLDAFAALGRIGWSDRATVRDAYAATVVKRHHHRDTFDALFDLYFPRMLGDGGAVLPDPLVDTVDPEPVDSPDDAGVAGDGDPQVRDSAGDLTALRDRLLQALTAGQVPPLEGLAAETVGRFGAMPGRGPGLSAWSAYTALSRVSPTELTDRIVAALLATGRTESEARATAARRIGRFTRLVEADANRRVAAEKGVDKVAPVVVRPSIDRLDFAAARPDDLERMRREIYPLARRLAARLTKERHGRGRGALDVRRTVRASMSTGGVPLTVWQRPKHPHRTELVVLCDVSGSVASFAQFTLLLVFALREEFSKVRAFTFVDQAHEITDLFRPGAPLPDVLADVAAGAQQAARWGRTNYGRSFTSFATEYSDALGPKSSLLILGDARSNYSDLALPVLRQLTRGIRQAWWLNPEHPRQWATGDSAAGRYGELVPMVECRNLTQLAEFVHDLV